MLYTIFPKYSQCYFSTKKNNDKQTVYLPKNLAISTAFINKQLGSISIVDPSKLSLVLTLDSVCVCVCEWACGMCVGETNT